LENLGKNNEGNNLHDYKLILLLFFTINLGHALVVTYTTIRLVMLKIQVRVPPILREPMQTLNLSINWASCPWVQDHRTIKRLVFDI
jgi:hypothetical protein